MKSPTSFVLLITLSSMMYPYRLTKNKNRWT